MAQILYVVIEATALLKLACSRAVFVMMIGGGIDFFRLKNKVASMQLSNIVFFTSPSDTAGGKVSSIFKWIACLFKKRRIFSNYDSLKNSGVHV